MKLLSTFCVRLFVVAFFFSAFSLPAEAQIRIVIGTPKITVGTPKIVVPTPATIVKNVVNATEVAVNQTGNVVGNVGNAAGVAAKQTGQVAGNVVTATGVAIHQTGKATEVAVNQTGKVIENVGKAGEVAVNQTGKVVENVAVATVDAANDVVKATEVAINQTGKAIGKGGEDVVREAGRVPGHVVDVGSATVKYVESYGNSAITTIEDAARRIKQGKIVDALFHVALAPLQAQEEAAFKATQESSWVNSAAAVAASAYGGPGGSASYAAWQTYRLSGNNMEMAVRAGLVAGLTNAASGAVEKMDPDLIKSVILGGAIGGAAMAASGADEESILDGIIMGGSMVLVQEAYQGYVGHTLDPTAPTEPPYCMSLTDPSCNELVKAYTFDENGKVVGFDPSKLDPKRSHVGIQADVEVLNKYLNGVELTDVEVRAFNKIDIGLDRSDFMQNVAQTPATNSMGLFHDKWALDWDMGPTATKLTIIPAIAVIYVGTGAQLYTSVPEQVVENNTSKAGSLGNSPVTQDSITTVPNPNLKTALENQEGMPANADSVNIIPTREVVEALKEYHDKASMLADSIATANKGVEVLVENELKPAVGWEWVDPTNENLFAVHPIEGIEVDSQGRLRPAVGWEWVDQKNPLSMEVRKISGVEIGKNGKLRPAKGWRWRFPKDPDNIEVEKK